MSGLSEQDFIKIIDLCKLDETEGQLFRQSMRKTKVQKLKIRQILCEEGKRCHQAFYLLEGMVNLTICLTNGERIILSQIGKGELLNLELILNDWRNKYTIVVCSSYIRYVVIQDSEIMMLTANIREDIHANLCFRQREVGSKNRRIADEQRNRKMRQTIDKLSLPNINLQSLNKKELISHISEQNIQNKGESSGRIITDKIGSYNMSKQLHSGSQPRYKLSNNLNPSIQFKSNEQLQTNSQEFIPPIQHKNAKAEFKLQRLSSEKSMSLHDHNAKQEISRNERLFKSQLKHIVKRKLLFERKHFQILQRIAYKESKPPIKKVNPRNEGSPLDNYFNL